MSIADRLGRCEKIMSSSQIDNKSEILIEGELVGVVKGLRFFASKRQEGAPEQNIAKEEIAQKLAHIGERLISAPNDEIILGTDANIRWNGEIIASLKKGEEKYFPNIILLADELISQEQKQKIIDRLNLWLRHHINSLLEQILALKEPYEIEGDALKLCQKLYENYGIVPRRQVLNIVKNLDQDVRAKLRALGIRFGAYHIYLPLTLKPAPRELLLINWALHNDFSEWEKIGELVQIILLGRTSFTIDSAINRKLYEIAGFKLAGNRAVRIDILERLANIIRPLIALDSDNYEGELPPGAAPKNGFRVNVEMTSLLGCAGEDFSSILKSIGYRVERTKIEQAGNNNETANNDSDNGKEEIVDNLQKTKVEGEESKELEEQYDEIWYFDYQRQSTSKKPSSKNKKQQNKDKAKKSKKPPKQKLKPINKDSPFAALAQLKLKN